MHIWGTIILPTLIYPCIMTIFITLYKDDLACKLVPDFFICFISYHNPKVFTTLDLFLFLKCAMLIPEFLLMLFHCLCYSSSLNLHRSPSPDYFYLSFSYLLKLLFFKDWILWLPTWKCRVSLHPLFYFISFFLMMIKLSVCLFVQWLSQATMKTKFSLFICYMPNT